METKQQALAAVGQFSSKVRAIIMQSTDGLKIAGLADKARDAAIFIHHPADDPDEEILKALLTEAAERNRGETPTTLALSILANAAKFKQIRAKLDGLESRFYTAVEMAPTDAYAVVTYNAAKGLTITELTKLGISVEVLNSL